MKESFFRVVSASPTVTVADIEANTRAMTALLQEVAPLCPDMIVFPELAVCAYTCADLLHNSTLIDAVVPALETLAKEAAPITSLVWVGAPLLVKGQLYNCAVALTGGRVVAAVPKTFLPGYNEFYETRWFMSAPETEPFDCRPYGMDHDIVFGTDIIINVNGAHVAAEICEDLWAPVPPSSRHCLNGAEVVANLSASDDIVGKYPYLRSLLAQQSARCVAGYVYSSAGFGESTTDLVFDGKNLVFENGTLLAEGDRYARGNKYVAADIDLMAIRRDRLHLTTYGHQSAKMQCSYRHITTYPTPAADDCTLLRKVDPAPFVPSDTANLAARCEEIIHIQQSALAKRLQATRCNSLVVGISGGLDSTLALLVAVRAFDSLGLDRKGITGITMPGFGTTGRTHGNAVTLMDSLGVTSREIPIADAVNGHFRDIGHDPEVKDVTYENCQARERTQILMDVANQLGGMVLGTGDLSELALGWATYNGDHMSMYGVNSGVPKTLVRHLVGYFASTTGNETCRAALEDIIDTPVSPELLPADADGNIAQKTEDLVGPYELHDFFLYQMLRYGFSPRRIYMLACNAFRGVYKPATIKKWLTTFIRRFFAQQFKRSCLPDGPKVGSVTLSPRGDWRMPSDASATLWLEECENL